MNIHSKGPMKKCFRKRFQFCGLIDSTEGIWELGESVRSVQNAQRLEHQSKRVQKVIRSVSEVQTQECNPEKASVRDPRCWTQCLMSLTHT